MKPKIFLENLETFLRTGITQDGNDTIFVENRVLRVLDSCMLFDRYMYNHPYSIGSFQFSRFYSEVLDCLYSCSEEYFEESVKTLDPAGLEILLSHIGTLNSYFPEHSVSQYTTILLKYCKVL